MQTKAICKQATVPPVRRNAPNEKNLPQVKFYVKHAPKIALRPVENQGVFDCKRLERSSERTNAWPSNPKSYTRLPKSYWTEQQCLKHRSRQEPTEVRCAPVTRGGLKVIPLPRSRKPTRSQDWDSIHPPLQFPSTSPEEIQKRDTNPRRPKQPESVKVALDSKLLVSRGEAAQLLSISERGVDYLISAGRLPTKRIGGRVLIPVAELRRYARSDHPEPIVS